MGKPSHFRSLARWLLLGVVALATLVPAEAIAQERQKQVLVIYSARRDAQIAIVGERELPRILDEGVDGGIDYYSEHLDNSRFPDPKYQTAFRNFLETKYQG